MREREVGDESLSEPRSSRSALSRAGGPADTLTHTALSRSSRRGARALCDGSASTLPPYLLVEAAAIPSPRCYRAAAAAAAATAARSLSLAISLLLAHVVPASVRTGGERKGGTHCVPSPSTTLSLGFFAARDLCLMSMWLWDGYGTTLGYTSKKEERSAQ